MKQREGSGKDGILLGRERRRDPGGGMEKEWNSSVSFFQACENVMRPKGGSSLICRNRSKQKEEQYTVH